MRFAEFPGYFRLMLLASRTRQTVAEQDEIGALLRTSIDWKAFLAVTSSHRLMPLVLAGLEAQPAPPQILSTLRYAVQQNTIRAAKSIIETRRIAERFAEEGVEIITLKGRGLAQTVYGDPRMRHAGDLDILSRQCSTPSQIERHIAVMRELGYTLINPEAPLTPLRIRSYHRFWKDLTFRHEASSRPLDLHWRLFNNQFHPGNRLLRGAQAITLEIFSTPIRTLPAHDQFLHIALHGVSDEWIYLKSLADVAAFLRGLQPEEFEAVLKRASELDLLPQISSAVHLARELFGVRAFHPMLCQRTHWLHVRLRQRLLDRLERADFQPVRTRLGAVDAVRFELMLVPHSLTEIVLRFLYRPRVWSIVSLPDALFHLYPVLGLLVPPRGRPGRAVSGPDTVEDAQ